MNTFWLHRDQIYEQGLSLGFRVFSPGHLLWLAGLALFCFLTGRLYRSLDEKGRDNMRKACGLAIVLLEYMKVIVLGLFGVHMAEFVPLHLCSAAGLGVLVWAMWPRMNWLGQVFAYAFVPALFIQAPVKPAGQEAENGKPCQPEKVPGGEDMKAQRQALLIDLIPVQPKGIHTAAPQFDLPRQPGRDDGTGQRMRTIYRIDPVFSTAFCNPSGIFRLTREPVC